MLSLQLVGHELIGSQVSPDSTVPLLQRTEQSLSVLLLHPAGQQPSLDRHCVMV
jgi:hypothetical protein